MRLALILFIALSSPAWAQPLNDAERAEFEARLQKEKEAEFSAYVQKEKERYRRAEDRQKRQKEWEAEYQRERAWATNPNPEIVFAANLLSRLNYRLITLDECLEEVERHKQEWQAAYDRMTLAQQTLALKQKEEYIAFAEKLMTLNQHTQQQQRLLDLQERLPDLQADREWEDERRHRELQNSLRDLESQLRGLRYGY